MAKQNETHEDRIFKLEYNDTRRDGHINDIRENVKNIAEMQKEILIVLGGSKLSKSKGALEMLDEVKDKLTALKKMVDNHDSDLRQVKFWGRGTAGIAFVSIGLVFKKIFNL